MKNIRPQKVIVRRITAVQVTPVKIARNGTRWTRKNGMDVRGLILPWGRRSAVRVHLPRSEGVAGPAGNPR